MMDDLEIMANPEYLAISTHLNMTTNVLSMSIKMDVKKVKTIFSSVVLHCKIKWRIYQKIYRVIDELCSKTKKDELIQYAINLIEQQFGDLKIFSCPIKMVIIEKKLNSLA